MLNLFPVIYCNWWQGWTWIITWKSLGPTFSSFDSLPVTLQAVVSPGWTLRFNVKETTVSNRLFFHQACASTWWLRISNDKTATRTLKKKVLISKTTTLHVHHAFIFAFLCHFCATTTRRCLILRFVDNVNKQRWNLFSFRSWTWIWPLGIQLHLGSPTFDKVSR